MREGTTLPGSDRPTEPPIIDCDARRLRDVDLGTLDTLARMQLVARRMGFGLRIVGASPALRGLLALTGLEEVLPCQEDADGETSAPGPSDTGIRPPR